MYEVVAVSKNRTIFDVKRVVLSGYKHLAENRISEAEEKYSALQSLLADKGVQFHFIGHLQSNKVRSAVRMFDVIQSVDSVKLARKISLCAIKLDKVQRILVQINSGEEKNKYGFHLTDVESHLNIMKEFNGIQIEGLMAVHPYFVDIEKTRRYFRKVYRKYISIKNKYNFNIL